MSPMSLWMILVCRCTPPPPSSSCFVLLFCPPLSFSLSSSFATLEIVRCQLQKCWGVISCAQCFCKYWVLSFFFFLSFFKKAFLMGYVGWAIWMGSPMLNCILPLCLPLDIWREGLKWFGLKPLWSTFHLYGQDRTSNWGAIRSRQWYASYSINWKFWSVAISCMSYLTKPYVLYFVTYTIFNMLLWPVTD